MPRLIARSMVSFGMFCALASVTALRRRALESTSPLPPVRAATVISLIIFVKILPRLASSAPFLCLIVCHLECPDMFFLARSPEFGIQKLRVQAGGLSSLRQYVERFQSNWKYTTLNFRVQNGKDSYRSAIRIGVS